MANLSKPQVSFSKSDFKKAALKANKKLEVRNKSIESSIKDQERQLKSLEKEYNSKSKEVGKVQKDINFQEERLQKINSGIYSNVFPANSLISLFYDTSTESNVTLNILFGKKRKV